MDFKDYYNIMGLERNASQDEIKREIKEVWGRDESDTSLADVWRRTLSMPLALVLVGPAVAVFLLARRTRRRVPSDESAAS